MPLSVKKYQALKAIIKAIDPKTFHYDKVYPMEADGPYCLFERPGMRKLVPEAWKAYDHEPRNSMSTENTQYVFNVRHNAKQVKGKAGLREALRRLDIVAKREGLTIGKNGRAYRPKKAKGKRNA